jgi:hypothetical protein
MAYTVYAEELELDPKLEQSSGEKRAGQRF